MVTDLVDYVPHLRREVTPPGSDLFADVDDAVFGAYLTDAFWEARLDGFFEGFIATEEGDVTPDMARQDVALVILYAGIKVLRNRLINMSSTFRVQAGPVEYETQYSATVIAEMLRQLRDLKDRYLEQIEQNTTPVYLTDATTVRRLSFGSYAGHFADTFGELVHGG